MIQLYIEEMYIGSCDTYDQDYLEVNNIRGAKYSSLSDHFLVCLFFSN